MTGKHFKRTHLTSLLLLALGLMFSFWLMFHTFSVDTQKHQLQISSKLWSDFGAHIPMIRSFSKGPNMTRLLHHQAIESPLFPGEPIRYHFGFFAIIGLLEKLGLPLDWAVNIPSALGFFLLLTSIYMIAYKLFNHVGTAMLSVLFFLFNGSLSFLSFFKAHPLSTHTLNDVITSSKFSVFGPWDGNVISAFWNLNIYTNQRHLALSYGLVLATIMVAKFPPHLLRKHLAIHSICIATLLGTLMFINFPVAAIATLFLTWIFVHDKHTRQTLFVAFIATVPALLWLQGLANPQQNITFQTGYLAPNNTPATLWNYWWQNLGLHMLLVPIGIMCAPRPARRLVTIPLIIVFLLPNIFRFSPDMINNHKFFNFALIVGGMFSAHALYTLTSRLGAIRPIGIMLGVICLTLSGVIDFFPVVNDYKGTINDTPSNRDVEFFIENTNPDDIIANSTWFYHPASLAGRALFSGYTYFTWSYGYDQGQREKLLTEIYEAPNQQVLCIRLRNNGIAYVELNPKPEKYLHPNLELWHKLQPSYTNTNTGILIYKTQDICP
ncbi:hypothetical protein KBC80_03795 [Candidatus Woesebacteria bacterium]|nr:hypothetical protein [Candidatus Woesebacteria bacterium]